MGNSNMGSRFIKEGRLKDIVDYDIRREISSKCLKQFARIAEKCLDNHPKHRPTMAEVVLRLEYVLTLHEKTNNMSSKTIFGRMADKFSFAGHGQSPGIPISLFMCYLGGVWCCVFKIDFAFPKLRFGGR
ncbi:putative non-specific serine/threonine protein kinase [Helianthus debilis subsp. tardiflorus]